MLPKRLMNFRHLLAFGLASVLLLLLSGGCRVPSTPTGEPTETPCQSCQPPESPLVAALNSPLAITTTKPTQSIPSPVPTTRPNAQPPAGTPTLVVKTATAVPLDETAFNVTIVHSNDTWGYLDPCG